MRRLHQYIADFTLTIVPLTFGRAVLRSVSTKRCKLGSPVISPTYYGKTTTFSQESARHPSYLDPARKRIPVLIEEMCKL